MATKTRKPSKRIVVNQPRTPCCGVPLNLPYKALGCPTCNPGFWLTPHVPHAPESI